MGYDSYGDLIPFDECVNIEEDPDDFLEEALTESAIADAAAASATTLAPLSTTNLMALATAPLTTTHLTEEKIMAMIGKRWENQSQ